MSPSGALIFDLKQVAGYMGDVAVHDAVQERVVAAIGPDTRVVVAHSLGSVVAYEVLCDPKPDWAVDTLVTALPTNPGPVGLVGNLLLAR